MTPASYPVGVPSSRVPLEYILNGIMQVNEAGEAVYGRIPAAKQEPLYAMEK